MVRILHVSAGLRNPLAGNWELDMIKRGVSRILLSYEVTGGQILLRITSFSW